MTTLNSPAAIDLSRVPAPAAIEPLSFETLLQGFVDRFKTYWDALRAANPALPAYDVDRLQYDPVIVLGRTWSYFRMLDRQRVNDGIKALIAPLATKTNLDNLVVRQGIVRLVVTPATPDAEAVMETDERLLLRYLLSFERAAAGSRDCYLFHAYSAWPGAGDIAVVGRAIHGRRGDVDIVICGPGGRAPTTQELAAVRGAVLVPSVQPETTSVTVLAATRHEYGKSLVIELPAGPDANVVRQEAVARVTAAADSRTLIGGEIPADLLPGAAYGQSILNVRDLTPLAVERNAYTVPVMTALDIAAEVRA